MIKSLHGIEAYQIQVKNKKQKKLLVLVKQNMPELILLWNSVRAGPTSFKNSIQFALEYQNCASKKKVHKVLISYPHKCIMTENKVHV